MVVKDSMSLIRYVHHNLRPILVFSIFNCLLNMVYILIYPNNIFECFLDGTNLGFSGGGMNDYHKIVLYPFVLNLEVLINMRCCGC